MEKNKCKKYKRSYFNGGGNNIYNIIICKIKVSIPKKSRDTL